MKAVLFASPLALIVASAPLAAQAESVWHPSYGEESFLYMPEHFKSSKSRSEVAAEVDAARRDGTLLRMFTYQPAPRSTPAVTKTRGEVAAEVDAARTDGTLERMFTYQPAPRK